METRPGQDAYIRETLQTKITDACDVLVCGGGVAGIAAALAAARQGKRVILLERQFELGGLATAGLVTIYLPLCDGLGRQVSFGLAEELLRLSIAEGYEDNHKRYPDNWLASDDPARRTAKDPRFEVQFNPHLFAILAEQQLLRAGVAIRYGAPAVAAIRTGDRISAVIVEGKSGREAIRCTAVVDASGDADIAALAGAPTDRCARGNSVAGWYYAVGREGYSLKTLGWADRPDSELQSGLSQVEYLSDRRFSGLDTAELSEFMQLSHAHTLKSLKQRREQDPALLPVTIATVPQVRMTRKLIGEASLDGSDEHRRQDDSIGMIANWRRRGPVYEVPFGTLYSRAVPNLILAGRCVSSTQAFWDILRVIPCCAVTGQAAGTAAALFDDFAQADVRALQAQLQRDGVVLHEDDLPR